MKIEGSVALVTGANRGLGRAYAKALLDAGARKVYAGARDPASVKLSGVVPVKLDLDDPATIAAAAAQCADVDLLVNNAGIAGTGASLLSADGAVALGALLQVNLFGMLAMSQAFAPVLRANGGGALVNMLSALSWTSLPSTAAYSVSKAAAWALTNGLRNELRAQGTLVVGVHAGFIDTDMTKDVSGAKERPEDIAQRVIAALVQDAEEVLADATSRQVKAGFGASPPIYLGRPG